MTEPPRTSGPASGWGWVPPRDWDEQPPPGHGEDGPSGFGGAPPPGYGEEPPPGLGGPPPPRRAMPDLSGLLIVLEAVRRLLPRELEQQFSALLRELLLTLRALIDWYIERLDGQRVERRAEEIPIE